LVLRPFLSSLPDSSPRPSIRCFHHTRDTRSYVYLVHICFCLWSVQTII
jgi:hypothetical protein